MNAEQLLQLNNSFWPFAIMAFLRILSIFIFLPMLGEREVPPQLRIVLAIAVTIAVWPVLEKMAVAQPQAEAWGAGTFLVASLWEVFFGVAMGFGARAVIYAAEAGADIAGVNMGFQAGAALTGSGSSGSELGKFYHWIAIMLILILNVHHDIIRTIIQSFESIPLGQPPSAQTLLHAITEIITGIFTMGLRIATPILVVQFLTTLALVAIARAVPQFNVFLVNFPLGFLLGMVIIFFGASTMIAFLGRDGMHLEVKSYHSIMRAFATPNQQGPGL